MDFASYISGFVDGEGCFSVSFNFRAKLKTGIEVRPSFSLSQNKRNLQVLEEIQAYFDCGGLRFSRKDQNYKFEVRNLSELCDRIIPHFKKYVLKTSKKRDFEIFCEICLLMRQSKHLNPDCLRKIIQESYKMNESGKRKYKQAKLLSTLDKMKI